MEQSHHSYVLRDSYFVRSVIFRHIIKTHLDHVLGRISPNLLYLLYYSSNFIIFRICFNVFVLYFYILNSLVCLLLYIPHLSIYCNMGHHYFLFYLIVLWYILSFNVLTIFILGARPNSLRTLLKMLYTNWNSYTQLNWKNLLDLGKLWLDWIIIGN